MVGNVAHIDEGVRCTRATGPRSWGNRARAGSIKVDYQTELQQLVLRVFIQVQGVVRIGLI